MEKKLNKMFRQLINLKQLLQEIINKDQSEVSQIKNQFHCFKKSLVAQLNLLFYFMF